MGFNGNALAFVIIFVATSVELCRSQIDINLERKIKTLEAKQADFEDRLEDQEEFKERLENAFAFMAEDISVKPATTPLSIVTPLEVRREKMPTGYRFTVRYVPHAQNLRIAYIFDTIESNHYETYNVYHDLKGMPDERDDRVMMVMFMKDFGSDDSNTLSFLYFYTDTEKLGIKVYMGPSSDDILETPVHLPDFPVTPTGHLVYEPGYDTDIITINYTEWSVIHMSGVVYDPYTTEFLIGDIRYSTLFNDLFVPQYDQEAEQVLSGRLETSQNGLSGYVDVMATKFPPPTSNPSAVEVLQLTKRLIFHPADQSSPFPDGSTGFAIHYDRLGDQLEDGTSLRFCNITNSNPCQGVLDIVATGSVEVTCMEVVNNKTTVSLPVRLANNVTFDEYLKQYIVTVENRTAHQASSQVWCRAVSDTGFVATRNLLFVYFIQPRVLVDRSSAVMKNGNLTVTCVTTGQPKPTLTLNVEHGHYRYSYHRIPENQTVLSSDGTITTGTFSYDYGPEETVANVSCSSDIVVRNGARVDYLAFGHGVIQL